MQIRTATPNDLDRITAWAQQAGWNPGLYDAECLHQMDESNFFIGEVEGVAVGCIAAIAYDDRFGFICFYSVDEAYKGQGYGGQLWQQALQSLGARTIGLDDTEGNYDYSEDDFVVAYRNLRWQGMGGHEELPLKDHQQLVSLNDLSLDQVLAYDHLLFPVSRRAFLSYWINHPQTDAVGVLENGELAGYGILHPCTEGYKISPLFANHRGIARAIVRHFSHKIGQTPFFIDVPETNPGGVNMAMRLGMHISFKAVRMYRGEMPSLQVERMYGISTFELA